MFFCTCIQNGWTALHLAAQEGKVDVVRLLTESQAQVNIETEVYTHSWYNRQGIAMCVWDVECMLGLYYISNKFKAGTSHHYSSIQ